MGDAHSRIVLLSPINAVWEGIVGHYAVKLRGWLVIVGTPVFTTIKRHLSATIVTDDHALRVFGSNPKVVVVTVRRIGSAESTAAIG